MSIDIVQLSNRTLCVRACARARACAGARVRACAGARVRAHACARARVRASARTRARARVRTTTLWEVSYEYDYIIIYMLRPRLFYDYFIVRISQRVIII